jgi:hypothetical protein
LLAAACAAASAGPPLRSALGTNLEALAEYSPQLPFADVMKSSGAWISGQGSTWDSQQELALDANGWVRSLAPGQVARKLMLREIEDRYPAGEYIVRYKGEGTLKFGFAAKVVSQKPGEMRLQVTPNAGGVYLSIEATNPANHLREIAVIMPGGICKGDPFTLAPSAKACADKPFLSFAEHPAEVPFNPVFLGRLRSYSVLRFMDWMRTNNSAARDWAARTSVSYGTWAAPGGAPLEAMIALANVVQAHAWFTLPHLADDAYARGVAELVKQRLDAKLHVYVEHSNEVWNPQFRQHAHATKQGDWMQYHALRTRAIGRIFKEVLGEARVTTVLGAQAANVRTATRGLEHLKAAFRGELGIDAVAIAPYFGALVAPAQAPAYEKMNLDELYASAATSVAQAGKWVAEYRDKVARPYGVRLIAYEGGQHMVGMQGAENNAALNKLFDAFNRDRRLKQAYLDYLGAWKGNGGELFVHFNDVSRYTKWGRWGALEYIAQPREAAPKFDALQAFIEHNPVWWKP